MMNKKMGLSVALCVVGGAIVGAAMPLQQLPGTAGVVLVYSAGEGGGGGAAVAPTVVGLGFAAAPNQVVAFLPAGLPDTVLVEDGGGTRAEATRLAYDSVSGLALLAVPTLGVEPYPFVFDSARVGQEVMSATRDPVGDSIFPTRGSVQQVDTTAAGEPVAIRHNAFVGGQFNPGAPLLNLCGEVVGAVGADSDTAVPAERLLVLFGASGLAPTTASGPCLTAEEQAREAEVRADSAEEQAREAEARADSAEARADSAEARADSTGNPQDQAMADSLRLAAESAENDAELAQIAADSLRAAAEREQQKYLWIIVGLVVLAMFGMLAWGVSLRSAKRARREQERAEREQEKAELLAEAVQTELEDRESRDRIAGQVPAVLFTGADAHGNSFTINVPGREIASGGGAVVGRNPSESSIVLNHPEVSRRHFRLSVDGTRVLIEDLQSTNGTRVGNVALTPGRPAELRDHDSVHVGSVRLRVTFRR